MRNNRKGFTIVELVIVIAVIAILAAVMIPTFSGIIGKAQESAALQEASALYKEAYAVAISDGKISGEENGEGSSLVYYEDVTAEDLTFRFVSKTGAIDDIDSVTVYAKSTTAINYGTAANGAIDGYNVTVVDGVVKVAKPTT